MATDARLKLERAREHIAEANEVVAEWLAGPDFQIVQVRATDGWTEARVRLTGSPPPKLSLVIGDAVHNLRSALDNAVFAAARSHAGGTLDDEAERQLQFVVARSKQDFDRQATRWLRGVSDDVRRVIEEQLQPYHLANDDSDFYRFHALWQINQLDVIDKHRRLTITAAAVRDPGFTLPAGAHDFEFEFHRFEGEVVDGQLLVGYPGAELGVSYFYDRGVALMEGPVRDTGFMVAELLGELLKRAEWAVTLIEQA